MLEERCPWSSAASVMIQIRSPFVCVGLKDAAAIDHGAVVEALSSSSRSPQSPVT